MGGERHTVTTTDSTFERAVKGVGRNTAIQLMPLWMNNFALNLRKARNGDSLDRIYRRPPAKKVLIVGRGPSLLKHQHLDILQKKPFPGTVVASDGALPHLIQHNIPTRYSITVDGSEVIQKWYRTARSPKTGAVLPVTAHPTTIRAAEEAGMHVYWYIPALGCEEYRGATEILQLQTYSKKNPTGLSTHNGAGCSGLSALVFAHTILRATEIVLIGMDNGYLPDTPLTQLHYHDSLLKACGYSEEQCARMYSVLYSQAWGEYCIVDPVFEVYRRTFDMIRAELVGAGVHIVNATEGGCLTGDGVRCTRLKDYLDDQGTA